MSACDENDCLQTVNLTFSIELFHGGDSGDEEVSSSLHNDGATQ